MAQKPPSCCWCVVALRPSLRCLAEGNSICLWWWEWGGEEPPFLGEGGLNPLRRNPPPKSRVGPAPPVHKHRLAQTRRPHRTAIFVPPIFSIRVTRADEREAPFLCKKHKVRRTGACVKGLPLPVAVLGFGDVGHRGRVLVRHTPHAPPHVHGLVRSRGPCGFDVSQGRGPQGGEGAPKVLKQKFWLSASTIGGAGGGGSRVGGGKGGPEGGAPPLLLLRCTAVLIHPCPPPPCASDAANLENDGGQKRWMNDGRAAARSGARSTIA